MLEHHAAPTIPTRPARWIFGGGLGIQVWGVEGDTHVWASVLLGSGSPIVLLNHSIVGSQIERGALDWAMSRIAHGVPGFFILHAS